MSAKTAPQFQPMTEIQIQYIIQVANRMAQLSLAEKANQELTLVFKDGHIAFINASHNTRAPDKTEQTQEEQ